MPITRHFKNAKASCTKHWLQVQSSSNTQRSWSNISENNFRADNAVPQVHMIINIASETCHHLAFLITSDSSTCTVFAMTSTSSTWLESRKSDEGSASMSSLSLTIPPMCLLNQKLNMMRRRRRPSKRTVYGLLSIYHHPPVVVAQHKKRVSLFVPAAILTRKYWDNIKSI